ncbi:MAG: hypothetical protein D6728_12250 [Cyanobacteria bacterium J055]|nr:MAG: hypothetical protein D6728_12250 [Cyanobacteria bacterium J055]
MFETMTVAIAIRLLTAILQVKTHNPMRGKVFANSTWVCGTILVWQMLYLYLKSQHLPLIKFQRLQSNAYG